MKNINIKKVIRTLPIAIVIVGSTYLLSGCIDKTDTTTNLENIEAPTLATPDRPAEVNGLVRSIEGNEVTIAKEIKENNLTEEEREAQKDDRAAMTQEERQALKAELTESMETENVTLIIPVGVPIIKGSGVADGENVAAELAEIKSGVYISLWIVDDQVEAVKLKGIN